MTLKEQVLHSVTRHLGASLAIEAESGRIAYADCFFETICRCNPEGQPAETLFPWLAECPELSDADTVTEWETIDIIHQKYYKVESFLLENEKRYIIHHLTDITEYMKLNHDVSKYMSFLKKMSGFQTAIIEKLSSTYYELLPMLSDFFKADDMFFVLHREANVEIITYSRSMHCCSNFRILADEKALKVFSFDKETGYELSCFDKAFKEALLSTGISEEKHVYSLCRGDVSKQSYALFLVETDQLERESMKEETLLSVIRLYIENCMMREKLIYDSEHDGLTGMYNKGKYLARLESEYQNLDSVGILNFDINNLKKMNDTYGHEAGDKLIIKGADSIRKITASNIHGYRMGGDEFLVVACNVTQEQVEELKLRWEKELSRLNALDDGIECVMAAGVVYSDKGYDFATLMQIGDERMYEDKRNKKTGEDIR